MSRTNKGKKPKGFDYWKKRAGNECCRQCPGSVHGPNRNGPSTKRMTNCRERAIERETMKKRMELRDFDSL